MTLKDLRSYRAVSRMCWDLYVSSVKVISTTWSFAFFRLATGRTTAKAKKIVDACRRAEANDPCCDYSVCL